MRRTNGRPETSDFYCTKCGRQGIPISRRAGHGREAGHLKRLFCLSCKQEVNHVECKPFSHYSKDDFFIEFLNGNFNEDGTRKLTYGELKQKLNRGDVNE
jgi:hypothetical protein